jgi:probable rRNA maturation factor
MPTKRTASAPKKRNRKLVFSVHVACNAPGLPAPRRLRAWALAALRRKAEVNVRVVGAAEGRKLNRAFRGRDYATNVLTFVYGNRPLSGDVALCAPVIAREARDRGIALDAHYAHLLIHAMLHLQGYDHQTSAEAQTMEARETRLLAGLGYDDPYRGAPC